VIKDNALMQRPKLQQTEENFDKYNKVWPCFACALECDYARVRLGEDECWVKFRSDFMPRKNVNLRLLSLIELPAYLSYHPARIPPQLMLLFLVAVTAINLSGLATIRLRASCLALLTTHRKSKQHRLWIPPFKLTMPTLNKIDNFV